MRFDRGYHRIRYQCNNSDKIYHHMEEADGFDNADGEVVEEGGCGIDNVIEQTNNNIVGGDIDGLLQTLSGDVNRIYCHNLSKLMMLEGLLVAMEQQLQPQQFPNEMLQELLQHVKSCASDISAMNAEAIQQQATRDELVRIFTFCANYSKFKVEEIVRDIPSSLNDNVIQDATSSHSSDDIDHDRSLSLNEGGGPGEGDESFHELPTETADSVTSALETDTLTSHLSLEASETTSLSERRPTKSPKSKGAYLCLFFTYGSVFLHDTLLY